MTEGVSPSARIAASLKALAASAESLNAASNELSKPIAEIDTVLKQFNLGLTVWVDFSGDHDKGTGEYWSRDVGYAKVERTWGLAIRTTEGNHATDRHESEVWRFDQAPRSYRIDAVEKIPELVEKLIKVSDKTTRKLQTTAVEARELATAVTTVSEELYQERQAKAKAAATIKVKMPRKVGQ